MSRQSSDSNPLSRERLALVRAQLDEGERLAWAGTPELGAFEHTQAGMGKWDGWIILGGGYATLGAGVMAIRTGQWLWLSIPIALAVIGLVGFCIGRYIKARARETWAGTVYGLTTRRALIVETYPALRLKALAIEAITDVTLIDKRDGVADLSLGGAAAPEPLIFRGLDEPERTRAQLQRLVRDPKATEEEVAAAESYAMQMRQLMVRPM